jgi:hypothetical protein
MRARSASIDDMPTLEQDYVDADWKPIRRHLGITSFGTNAYVARTAGAPVIDRHTERADSGTEHEELFLVVRGHAVFDVDGEQIDAPAGTLVFVPDPASSRSAVARESGTTVVVVGATPGAAFTVSDWERKYAE